MAKGKRGRPKKNLAEKKEEVEQVKKEPKVEKVEGQELEFIQRTTHFDKTYEVGDKMVEKDEEMAKQLIDKKLARKV